MGRTFLNELPDHGHCDRPNLLPGKDHVHVGILSPRTACLHVLYWISYRHGGQSGHLPDLLLPTYFYLLMRDIANSFYHMCFQIQSTDCYASVIHATLNFQTYMRSSYVCPFIGLHVPISSQRQVVWGAALYDPNRGRCSYVARNDAEHKHGDYSEVADHRQGALNFKFLVDFIGQHKWLRRLGQGGKAPALKEKLFSV